MKSNMESRLMAKDFALFLDKFALELSEERDKENKLVELASKYQSTFQWSHILHRQPSFRSRENVAH